MAAVTGSGASSAGTGVSAAAAGFQGKIHGGKRCSSSNAASASGSATIRSPSGTRLAAHPAIAHVVPRMAAIRATARTASAACRWP